MVTDIVCALRPKNSGENTAIQAMYPEVLGIPFPPHIHVGGRALQYAYCHGRVKDSGVSPLTSPGAAV